MRARDRLTGDLFVAVPSPAPVVASSMDYRTTVAHLVSDVLRGAECDRYGVAASMSRYVGKDIAKATLDAYTAESRDAYNLPFYLAPALEAATGSYALTEWLAKVRGARILVGAEVLTAELGRLERERDLAGDRIKALREQMRGMR